MNLTQQKNSLFGNTPLLREVNTASTAEAYPFKTAGAAKAALRRKKAKSFMNIAFPVISFMTVLQGSKTEGCRDCLLFTV